MVAKKLEEVSLEIKFWRDWLKSDLTKRYKLVKKLSIVRDIENLENIKKLPKKLRTQFFVSLLNSYFEDLENTIRGLK